MITKRKLFSKEFCLFIFLILFATFVFNIVMMLMPQPKVLSWQDFACYNFEQITEINEDGESVTYNLISTPQQLAGALKKSNYLSATSHGDYFTSTNNYKLTKDINLSGYSWTPANNDTVIDGNYHTIYNLTISQSATQVGFISSNSGTIKNLSFVNISVKNNYSYNASTFTGGVVGYNTGTINNVSILSGTVAGNSFNKSSDDYARYVGGIVGSNYGTITNCLNKAEISTGRYVGGIIGYNNEGKISQCYNYGKVSSLATRYQYNGGIVGYVYSGTVSQCANWGEVTNYFVGYNNDLKNYINTAYSGGIVGYSSKTVSYCYNRGNIKAESKKGTYNTTSGKEHKETQVHKLYHNDKGEIKGDKWREYAYYSCSAVTVNEEYVNAFAGGICGQASNVTTCYSNGNITGGYRSESKSISGIEFKEDFYKRGARQGAISRDFHFKFYFTNNYANGISGYPISLTNCYYKGSVATNDVCGRYDVTYLGHELKTYIYTNFESEKRWYNYNESTSSKNHEYWISVLNLTASVKYTSGQYNLYITLDGCNSSSGVSTNPITFNFPNYSKGSNGYDLTSSTFYKNLDTNYFAYNSSFNNGYPYLKNLHWGQ